MVLYVLKLLVIAWFSYANELVTNDTSAATANDDACRDLKINESRSVDARAPFNSSSKNAIVNDHKMRFVVTRKSKDTYSVHIPVIFKSGSQYGNNRLETEALNTPDQFDAHADKRYRQLARSCIKNHNSLLRDKYGIRLELNIDDSPEKAKSHGIGVSTVEIVAGGRRANSEEYPEDIDCPTVIHELFHLTGLCDEYHEKTVHQKWDTETKSDFDLDDLGFENKPEYTRNADCRAEPSTNSIMNDHILALNGRSTTHKVTTYCQCAGAHCVFPPDFRKKFPTNYLSYRKGDREPECPKPFRKFKSINMDISDKNISSAGKNGDTVFLIVQVDIKPQPLHPAHTRHIIYPGCTAKNKKYYDCSSAAYETSDIEGCSEVSKKCKQDESWLD